MSGRRHGRTKGDSPGPDAEVLCRIEESLRLFSAAVEQIDESVILTDTNGIIQYVNRAFETITGFSRDDAIGQTPRILKSGRQTQQIYEALWHNLLAGESFHGVVVNRRKDGGLYHEEKTITPVRDASGKICHFIATGMDVTRQKLAEERLMESAERAALSLCGANDGLWDWDFRSGHIYFSARWKSMLGYSDREVGDHPEDWFDLIHWDDLAEFKTQMKSHIDGSSPKLEHEHRVRQRNGHYAWVLTRGQAARDESGKAYRIAGSQTDITLRKKVEEQLTHDALHDTLTSLPNRALFLDRLDQACHRASRAPDKRFALMFMDLDRFKLINDSLGHMAGDRLLKEVSCRVQGCVRASDTVARLGGDEFAILLEEIQTIEEAIGFADRILEQLSTAFRIEDREVYTSGSIGIILYHDTVATPEELVRDADVAMYHAKGQGRSRYAVFDGAMHSLALETLELEMDLRRALEDRGLNVLYQPVVDLKAGRVAGFEALVRWPHPSRGQIAPDEFLAIAEGNGLIYSLGLFVLREACRHLKILQAERSPGPPPFVSVNLSGLQLLRPELVVHADAILREFGLSPNTLELEIKETTLLQHEEDARRSLAQLKGLGVKLTLDNFGTGVSTLANLRRFSLDTLKVDKSWVAAMLGDEYSRGLVRATVAMAENLKMNVVAEGVETSEQARALKAMGCGFGQGFYYSEPLDASSSQAILHTRGLA